MHSRLKKLLVGDMSCDGRRTSRKCLAIMTICSNNKTVALRLLVPTKVHAVFSYSSIIQVVPMHLSNILHDHSLVKTRCKNCVPLFHLITPEPNTDWN